MKDPLYALISSYAKDMRFYLKGKPIDSELASYHVHSLLIAAVAWSLRDHAISKAHPQSPFWLNFHDEITNTPLLEVSLTQSSIFNNMPVDVAQEFALVLKDIVDIPYTRKLGGNICGSIIVIDKVLDELLIELKHDFSLFSNAETKDIEIPFKDLCLKLWGEKYPIDEEHFNKNPIINEYLQTFKNKLQQWEQSCEKDTKIITNQGEKNECFLLASNIDMASPLRLREVYHQLAQPDLDFFKELTLQAFAVHVKKEPNTSAESFEKTTLTADVVSALSAINNYPPARKYLAKKLKTYPSQIIYPLEVRELSLSFLDFIKENNAEFNIAGSDNSTTWFPYAKTKTSKLNLSPVLASALKQTIDRGDFCLHTFIDILIGHKEAPELELITLARFRELNPLKNHGARLLSHRKALRQQLLNKVIGQNKAIEQVCDAWFGSNEEHAKGPRIIYTFAGVSGVGKSHLARSLTQAINDVENTSYAFHEFSMSQFTDPRASSILFGAGAHYSDQPMGVLTSIVKACPRHVILLDEIEKADPQVITSFLRLLDSGTEKDLTSNELVDFSQVILIITTNLGQDILAKNSQNREIDVFDLLRTAKAANSNQALPVEIVNRLAKGSSIVFEKIQTHNLLRLAQTVIENGSNVIPGINIVWPNNFAQCYLKMLAPELTARRVGSELSKITAKMLSCAADHITLSDNDQIVRVAIDDQPPVSTQQLRLCIFDNDQRVYNVLESLAEKQQSLTTVDNFDALITLIKSHPPHALLIDIASLGNSEFEVSSYIEKIITINRTIPIISYAIEGEVSAPILARLQTMHDIRNHYIIHKKKLKEAVSSFTHHVHEIIQQEQYINQMIRLNQKVQYHWDYNTDPEGPIINLKLSSPIQVVASADASDALFQRSLPKERLKDVVGLQRAKLRLKTVIELLKQPEIFSSAGIKPPTGYILAGQPGTGKTLLAKAVAGESNLPFFTMSAGEIMSTTDGGPIEKIKKLFSKARQYAPAIVFIDEIDAIGKDRNKGGNNMLVNTLLTEMDGFTGSSMPVFVLAATNYPEQLDNALKRPGRFDEVIECDHPNLEARQQLLRMKFDRLDICDDDINYLADISIGLSAAQVEQLYREAMYLKQTTQSPLSRGMLEKLLTQIKFGAPSQTKVFDVSSKWETAYHEAGHLIVSKLLMPERLIDYVTIEPRDQALGFVAFRPDSTISNTKLGHIKNKLSVALAGRAAELIYGGSDDALSTGPSSDIEWATNMATQCVFKFGISTNIPAVNIPILSQYSKGGIAEEAEKVVLRLISGAETTAMDLLLKNSELLHRFAEKLHEKESMLSREIEEYFD